MESSGDNDDQEHHSWRKQWALYGGFVMSVMAKSKSVRDIHRVVTPAVAELSLTNLFFDVCSLVWRRSG